MRYEIIQNGECCVFTCALSVESLEFARALVAQWSSCWQKGGKQSKKQSTSRVGLANVYA